MCAQWLAAEGHQKVGLFWEQGSSGRDYADFFREEADRLGLTIARDVKLGPNPAGLAEHLRSMRDDGIDRRSTTAATATPRSTSPGRSAELDWDPPRVMGTAFMFYSNTNEWAEGLEGWHGVDQLGEDGANPNYERHDRAVREAVQPHRRATSSWPWPTTPPGPASTASPTPAWPRPRGPGRARTDTVDAGNQRRPGFATCSSVPATTRDTRATSSPSASYEAASCASTATTGPSSPPTGTSTLTS